MTRKKVKLAYITNQRKRRETFNKRKGGLIKKMNELSVLCGVEACAVIYSPFNSTNPEVWPSNSGVESVLSKFEMVPEMDKEKRSVNNEGFLKKSISKTMEKNNKQMKDNSDNLMKEVMFNILDGKEEKLELTNGNREDLCKYIDQYLKELYFHRNLILNQQPNVEHGESSSAAVANVRPIISSNHHIPEQVNSSTRDDDLLHREVDQQVYYPMMNPNEHLNINLNDNENQQQFGYPNVSQDGIGNSDDTNENEQQGLLIDQKMSSLTLDDNNRY